MESCSAYNDLGKEKASVFPIIAVNISEPYAPASWEVRCQTVLMTRFSLLAYSTVTTPVTGFLSVIIIFPRQLLFDWADLYM